jgi:hypothetical protein
MIRIGPVLLLCASLSGCNGASEEPSRESSASLTPAPARAPPSSEPPASPKPAAQRERAYLAAHPDQDEILDDARAEAEACDAGDVRQCWRLANRYEEGIGVPLDRDHAIDMYARDCERDLGLACVLGGWVLTASQEASERERGIALLRRACELDHLQGCINAAQLLKADPAAAHEVAALRARACRGGHVLGCDPGQHPVAAASPPTAEAVCPASFHWSTSQSGGPRLYGSLSQLDHEALLTALPSTLPGFTTERRGSTPAGRAGTRTSSAWADYVGGSTRIAISVIDRAPDCTLQPQTGAAMIASTLATDRRAREVDVGGWPALILVGPEGSSSPVTLTAWIADRCSLTISGQIDGSLDLAAAIDLEALAALCSQRPNAGLGAP